jgi:hypothetical protein
MSLLRTRARQTVDPSKFANNTVTILRSPDCEDRRPDSVAATLSNHPSNDRPHYLRGGPGNQIIAPSLEVTLVRGLG